jgi:hypothetical protein
VWLSTLFCPPGCGRIERPAFPAPSFDKGRTFLANLARKTRGEMADVYLQYCCLKIETVPLYSQV